MNISLIICIVGLVVYAICSGRDTIPAFIGEVGRLSFWVGLLAFLLGK